MKIIKTHPKGWKTIALRSFIKELESGVSVNSDEAVEETGVRILKTSCVSNGRFDSSQTKNVIAAEKERVKCPIKKGTIVISRMNTLDLVGACGLVMEEDPSIFLPDRLWQTVWNDVSEFEPKWIAQVLISEQGRTFLKSIASGSSGSMKNISKEQFLSASLPTPPLPEQRKIADILSTWDEALETLDALIAAKDRQKQALMQQLLTGRTRVKGFDTSGGKTKSDRFGVYPADWKKVALSDIIDEVSARNAGGQSLPVLSCTKHRGLVLSQEYFGKRVHAEDTSGYRVVRRGEFAYATNHIEEGSIGYQNLVDAGLVSPIYTVFRTKGEIDDNYLFRVLKSPLLIHFYQINTSASVDRRGSLRYDEFSRIRIWIPSKPEQLAIAAILDTADQELTLLRTQRQTLDQQKRGLMQRLLTGKIRVNIK